MNNAISLDSLDVPRIYLSADIDWAEDFMIDDMRRLIVDAGVSATIFATHPSAAVARIADHDMEQSASVLEVGLHPNFLREPPKPQAEELDTLLSSYPNARGVRNHVLYYHSRLLALYHTRGLRYFSNELMFLVDNLQPYYDWTGLLRFPIYWEDDVHCDYFAGAFELDLDRLLAAPGLKVFSFHPIHVYLNTSDFSAYHAHKEIARDEQKARGLRQAGRGVRWFFIALLERLAKHRTATLLALADMIERSVPYQGRNRAQKDPTSS
jgi:hypothetical protein